MNFALPSQHGMIFSSRELKYSLNFLPHPSSGGIYIVHKPKNTALFLIKYRVYLIYFSRLFVENCVVSGSLNGNMMRRYGENLMENFNHSIVEEGDMNCHRCGGIMVYEKFYGICEHFFGWRCISCGEISDPVILENRHSQKR